MDKNEEAELVELKEKIKQKIKILDPRKDHEKLRMYQSLLREINLQLRDGKPYMKIKTKVRAEHFGEITNIQGDREIAKSQNCSQRLNVPISALNALSAAQKLYVNAYYNDGLSLRKIAEKYGRDLSTVSRVITRAKRVMRVISEGCLLIDKKDSTPIPLDMLLDLPWVSKKQKQYIRDYLQGDLLVDIAEKHAVNVSTVSHMIASARKKTARYTGMSVEEVDRPACYKRGV